MEAERMFQTALEDYQTGKLDKAAALLRKLDKRHPGQADVYQLRGMVALQGRKPAAAVEILKAGAAKCPGQPTLLDMLGTALSENGDLDAAEAAYRNALDLAPDEPGVLKNLGNVCKKLDKLEDALGAYRQSLKLRPGNADTEYNLGTVLEDLGDLEGAAAAYGKASEGMPDDALVFRSLARALLFQGKQKESYAAVERAMEIDPDHRRTRETLGVHYFLQGRLPEAWAAYEFREWGVLKDQNRQVGFDQPIWAGEALSGKTVMVWAEQGAGDEVMFASMVPDLLDGGATVVLECDSRLIPLFGRSFPGVRCLPRRDQGPPERLSGIDYQISGGSLGRWFRPGFDKFPARASYLTADEERRDQLREKYREGGDAVLIGVAWRSVHPRMGDKKSMPLDALAPLAAMPGVRLINLQYGETAEERDAFEKKTGVAVFDDPDVDQLADLDAFAAQVAAMDLVVSISNTTVHIAGALGVPTWVMLPVMPMWRWLMDRDDSPWYSSVRLFRQAERDDWSGVVEKITAAFKDFSTRR